jgi:hypothetical protein
LGIIKAKGAFLSAIHLESLSNPQSDLDFHFVAFRTGFLSGFLVFQHANPSQNGKQFTILFEGIPSLQVHASEEAQNSAQDKVRPQV